MVTVQRRRPHYLVPLVLIGAGVLALVGNLGLVAAGFWDRLFQLWPLLLVVVGLEVLTGDAPARSTGRLAAFGLVVAIAAGATLYAIGPGLPAAGSASGSSSAPLGGLSSARLALSAGGGSVNITTADLGQDLYRAAYDSTGTPPSRTFAVNGGTLDIRVGNRTPSGWFGAGSDRLDLTLNQGVAWAVSINTAGASGTVDLTTASIRSFDLNSAGASLTLRLPAPTTSVPVTINGAGNRVTVALPAGTASRVTAAGMAAAVQLPDGERLDQAMGSRSWQSSDYGSAASSYSIELNGMGNNLILEVPQS